MNRFCIGEHTSADLNLLATQSITAEEAKSLNHVPHFFPTRQKVDQYNDNVLHNSTCEKVIITAIDIPPSGSSPKFKQQLQAALDKHKPESTGGLPKVITVAVNHQYDIISNIAVQDGIVNGAECCIKYIQPQAHDSTFPAIVWVQFEDSCVGKLQRQKYSYLQNTHILRDWTPIFAQKRSFLIRDVWVTHVQFPMRNAAAHTIHVAQSATFRQIYIDMSTNTKPPKHWWQHVHYVALSRVTTLSGLYLKDLNKEKISISRNVANYIADARKNAKLVLSYVPLYTYRTEQLKIIYNNCRSYKKHYHDIQANYSMMAADIICIAET